MPVTSWISVLTTFQTIVSFWVLTVMLFKTQVLWSVMLYHWVFSYVLKKHRGFTFSVCCHKSSLPLAVVYSLHSNSCFHEDKQYTHLHHYTKTLTRAHHYHPHWLANYSVASAPSPAQYILSFSMAFLLVPLDPKHESTVLLWHSGK